MVDAMRSNFEAFVVRLVRDSVAKGNVSQWSMRQGDRGKGVGVHWSTDLEIAKSFSMTHGPKFILAMFDSWLSVVIEATYTPGDEVVNPEQNSHAYGWDGRDEKEIPLRAGAPLNLTRVHVLVPSDMAKFVAAYDQEGEASTSSVRWTTIPLGFPAVAKTPGSRSNLGVSWYAPGKKRPIGYSTRATSDLVRLLAEDGLTVSQAKRELRYDPEGQEIMQTYIDLGYGDTTLTDLGVR